MHTITLADGGSHALGGQGLLKIEVFPVGGPAPDLRLTVTGDGASIATPNNTLAIVTDIPADAVIGVTTVSGADFAIDQSVRVTVTRSGEATVEFPVVRVGGIAEKTLGTITRSGESYLLNAFGSTVATDLPRPVMAVSSAVRARLTTAPVVRRLTVVADTGATMHRQLGPAALDAAVTVVRGIATVLNADTVEVATATGVLGQRSPAGLADIVTEAVTSDRTRVGASSLPRSEDATDVTVYLTATPVRGMVTDTARSVILVLGPGADDEVAIYDLLPDRSATTGALAITADLASSLADGDATAFAAGAAVIAGVLGATPSEVAR